MSGVEEKRVFTAHTVEDLEQIAPSIVGLDTRIFLLVGELGAGKTTLVKSLCSALGSLDEVSSPTFSLVNEYRDASENPIYHIDLYRLNSVEEAIQIGIEEYLHSGAWCFIEWPEVIASLVEDGLAATISLITLEDDSRRISILK
jgi:tRNA threonylcarbamoyladenosine biosynthesis protein TsaE